MIQLHQQRLDRDDAEQGQAEDQHERGGHGQVAIGEQPQVDDRLGDAQAAPDKQPDPQCRGQTEQQDEPRIEPALLIAAVEG